MTSIREMAQMVGRVNDRYCETHGIQPSSDWYVLKLQEEVGEVAAAHLAAQGWHRHDGGIGDVGRELADVVCFSLLIARDRGIDIEGAIREKWAVYDRPESTPNQTRG